MSSCNATYVDYENTQYEAKMCHTVSINRLDLCIIILHNYILLCDTFCARRCASSSRASRACAAAFASSGSRRGGIASSGCRHGPTNSGLFGVDCVGKRTRDRRRGVERLGELAARSGEVAAKLGEDAATDEEVAGSVADVAASSGENAASFG